MASTGEQPNPGPGWYPEPGTGRQRYWDGSAWGDYAPAAGGPPPAPESPAAPPQPAGAGVVLPSGAVAATPAWAAANLYSDALDPRQTLSPDQVEAYKRHTLTSFPTWALVLLSIVTIGIFPTIYLHLKHSQLPTVKHDDPSAGKAIGFMFIPLFNIYWQFFVWLRLVDRVNFQYRLRGQPSPVARNLALWTMITGWAGWIIIIGWLAFPILALISAAQIQSAANQLAERQL